jgi:hypothetical protein
VDRTALRRRLAVTTYRMLYWGRNHLPPGVRSLVGVALVGGGVLGFLPILGFWMLPVGVAFIALDLPNTRHRIDAWMLRLALEGKLDRPGKRRTGRRAGSATTDADSPPPPRAEGQD